MSRKLASAKTIARLHSVSTKTVSNWHGAGFITAYKVAGRGGLLFDVDEVAQAVATNDSMRTPAKMRGKVIELTEPVRIVADVVTP